MKVNRLETHDRLLSYNQQADYISKGCQDCINNRPIQFETHPFYIFAHKREIGIDERISIFNNDLQESFLDPTYQRKYRHIDEVPSARLIWQPRLSKPKAETNSMLFRYFPANDLIHVIWMLPSQELWEQYKKGLMTENKIVSDSIKDYQNDRNKLEKREDDDLSDETIDAIYKEIARSSQQPKFGMI
jgi:hypothetical protein